MHTNVYLMENPYFEFLDSKNIKPIRIQNSYFLQKELDKQEAKSIVLYFLDFTQAHLHLLDEIRNIKLKFPSLKVVTFNKDFSNINLTKTLNYGVDYPILCELGQQFLCNFIDGLIQSYDIKNYSKYQLGSLELDTLERTVKRGPHHILLRRREFDLLHFLLTKKGQVVSREEILEKVWKYHSYAQTNTVDVHFSKLRRKLDKGFPKKMLHTVWGLGYKLDLVP